MSIYEVDVVSAGELDTKPSTPALCWTPADYQTITHLPVHAPPYEEAEELSTAAHHMLGNTEVQSWQRSDSCFNAQHRTSKWTSAEDAIIIEQQAMHGNRWSLIARMLPGRSESAVKSRRHRLLKGSCGADKSNLAGYGPYHQRSVSVRSACAA